MNEQDKRIVNEAEEFEAEFDAKMEAYEKSLYKDVKPYDDERSLREVGMSYKDFI
jgi:hypothetical protein